MASTRTSLSTVSLNRRGDRVGPDPPAVWVLISWVRMMSTRSSGATNPETPLTASTAMEMARRPGVSAAARKHGVPGLRMEPVSSG